MRATPRILLAVIILACNFTSKIWAIESSNRISQQISSLELANVRTDVVVHINPRAAIQFSSGNGAVYAGVIAGSAAVVGAVCFATGGTGCVPAAVIAVIVDFFSGFAFSGREYPNQPNSFILLPPTRQKTRVQRLMTELEPGTWHDIGHRHVNGFNHTLHYFNGGSFSKLRAYQVPFITSSTLQKRVDENDQGGTVAEYAWQNDNMQPWQDFPSSSDELNTLGTDIANYMLDQQAVALCSDFADQDGTVASGIMTLGVNDQPFDFNTIGGEQNAFAMCASNDGL